MLPLRYSGSWSRGGVGQEKHWKLIGPLFYYRRVEDQHWSPHHTERRTEHGLTLNGRHHQPPPTLAVVVTRRLFYVEPQGRQR